MAPEMSRVNGLVAAPLTAMDLRLILWSFFWTDLRSKDRLVQLSLMSVQGSLAIELFSTVLNITEHLSVSFHVRLNIGQSVGCVIATLKLTPLYLILDTLTSP